MIEEKLRHHFASCSRLRKKDKKISIVIFCKGILFYILLVESGIVGFGIRSTAQGIRNPSSTA